MSRHINKQELIGKVRELAGLTNDEKAALLELLNEKKVYGLVWENHEEAVEEQLREQLPVLPRRKERPLAQSGIANPLELANPLEQETEIPAEWTEGMIED